MPLTKEIFIEKKYFEKLHKLLASDLYGLDVDPPPAVRSLCDPAMCPAVRVESRRRWPDS